MLRVTFIALVPLFMMAVADPAILPNLFGRMRTIFSESGRPGGFKQSIFNAAGRNTYMAAPAYGTYRPAPFYSYAPAPNYAYAYPPSYSYAPQYGYGSNMLGMGFPGLGQYIQPPPYNLPGIPKPDVIKEEAEHSSGHSHFGYNDDNGPETWPENYPECGGLSQSPIDIRLDDIERAQFAPLITKNHWVQPKTLKVENNGHSIQISGVWPHGKTPTVQGGPLKDIYQLQQLHYHWGKDDLSGSEHTVNGRKFPMELHVVHYNTKYGSYDEAIKHKDGLTVLGYFYEVTDNDNKMMDQVINYTNEIEGSEAKDVRVSDPFPIGILGLEKDQYITYPGSLTTPPCSEIVTWIVSIEPLYISRAQMQSMRTVVKDSSHEQFIHNFRPTQPLNGRTVRINM